MSFVRFGLMRRGACAAFSLFAACAEGGGGGSGPAQPADAAFPPITMLPVSDASLPATPSGMDGGADPGDDDAGAPCTGDPLDCAACKIESSGDSEYHFCSGPLTWQGARSACQGIDGGDLVHIDSAAEDTFVAEHVAGDTWIGATDAMTADTWMWVDDMSTFWTGRADGAATVGSYTHWAPGHPGFLGDCAVYFAEKSAWAAVDCSGIFGFVCEAPIDMCPDNPDKTQPGVCGCKKSDDDSDSDGTPDCKDACPEDPWYTKEGTCGCKGNKDPAKAGTPCDDGQCAANMECDGMGRCGDPMECCTMGVDTDGDGMDDCAEYGDDTLWTDADVFNGFHARQSAQCSDVGECAENDTLGEVIACSSTVIEELDQYAGWDFDDPGSTDSNPDDICEPGFGFMPSWSICSDSWSVDRQGFMKLAAGTHCFEIQGSNDEGCMALYVADDVAEDFGGWDALDGNTAALTQTALAAGCVTVAGGVYPIRLHFTMDDGPNAADRAMFSAHLLYCAGGGGPCTPGEVLPAALVRSVYP